MSKTDWTVDKNTILWAEDDPLAYDIAKVWKREGYNIEIAPTVQKAMQIIEKKYETEQKMHEIIVLDIEMPEGDWPEHLMKRQGKLAQKYPSLHIPESLRATYHNDPLVVALTGKSGPELEQELLDAGILRFLQKGKISPSDVKKTFSEIKKPLPPGKGCNVILMGTFASGKTTLARALFEWRQGQPTKINAGSRNAGGPIIFNKYSTNFRSTGVIIKNKEAHESFYAHHLPMGQKLEQLDRKQWIVYVESQTPLAAGNIYVYAMKKEAYPELLELFRSEGMTFYDKYIVSAEHFHDLQIDYITTTANPVVGRKLIDYTKNFGGDVLPVKLVISDQELMRRFARREKLSSQTLDVLLSSAFITASPDEKREILLQIQQKKERKLVENEQLTDIGIKACRIYDTNAQWKNFQAENTFIFNAEDYYNELVRLQRTIIKYRETP